MTSCPQLVFDGSFQDIGILRQAIGFDLDFRQLERGSLDARTTVISGDGIQLSRTELNRAFHQIGSGPENMLTFGLPVFEGSNFSWCAARPDCGALINFNLNGGFESVSPSGLSGLVISIHLDKLQFLANQLKISSRVESLVRKSSYWNSEETALLGNRISMMFRQMIVSGDSVIQENSEFIDDEIGIYILNELSQDAIRGEVTWGEQKQLVLKKSLEILNNPESLPITVAQLCASVGTSLSTLHRTFLNEFGISPKAYIRARIFSLVRDELGHAKPGALISDVANRWGIWHMGQFAHDYRRMFGELPSDTFKRNH